LYLVSHRLLLSSIFVGGFVRNFSTFSSFISWLDRTHAHWIHGQSGTVDHTADAPIQADVVDAVLDRLGLAGVFLVVIALRKDCFLLKRRVVVELDLVVHRQDQRRRLVVIIVIVVIVAILIVVLPICVLGDNFCQRIDLDY